MTPIPSNVSFLSPMDVGSIVFATSFASYFAFHKYEFDTKIPVVSLLVLVPAALSCLSFHLLNKAIATLSTFLCYWSLILLFTVLYRISPFHPLAKYPGPFANKISKFVDFRAMGRGHQHRERQLLHQKYGDIVRIGPNELSYCNTDGVVEIHSLPKGPFYHGRTENTPSLVHVSTPAEHTKRRRIWNRAFNSASLKEYDDIIVRRSQQLIEGFEKRLGGPIDVTKWMEYFSFDFMGDMAFGYSFDMMKEGDDVHGNWDTMMGSVGLSAQFAHMPWAMKFVRNVVNPGGRGKALEQLSIKMVDQRLGAGSMTKDLFYYLSNEDGKQEQTPNNKDLFADGTVAIVAGSDTTSTVLSSLWYYLLRKPVYYARLREEVDAVFPSAEEPFDQILLSRMPFLLACINEAMRLQPPVPSGSQRIVPTGSGGKMVKSHFVPEETKISVALYSIQRDPRYFSPYPEEFWPDRWLTPESRMSFQDPSKRFGTQMDVILDHDAFMPFSSGHRNCVGKGLAMNEMRVVVSYVVQRFDMKPAPGYDLDRWEKELQDFYVMKKGHLPVEITARA